MPRAQKAEQIALRIDLQLDPYGACTRRLLQQYADGWFLVRERGEKTGKEHLQGWVNSRVSHQTWGNALKKLPAYVLRGQQFSAVPVRKSIDEYMAYLCKGESGAATDDVRVWSSQCMYGTSEIESFHRQWHARAASVPKQVGLASELIEEAQGSQLRGEELASHLIKYCQDKAVHNRKGFQGHHVRACVTTAVIAVDSDIKRAHRERQMELWRRDIFCPVV